MNTADRDADRTLSEYLETLYRRRWSLAATAVVVFAGFAGYAFLSPPVYRATVLLDFEKPVEPLAMTRGYEAPDDEFLPTQASLVATDTALREVYDSLRLARAAEFKDGLRSLRKAVTVLPVPRTRLAYVHVESLDAGRAAAIANALAQRYVRQNVEDQRFMAKSLLAQLEAQAKSPAAARLYDALPPIAADPALQDIRAQTLKAEEELSRLRAVYTDEHPAVASARSQLEQLRAARRRELARAVLALREQLSGRLKPNNVRVVDAALPPDRPVRPRKLLALLLGALGGLGLGALAAFALDALDQTVRTNHDVERGLGLTLLGYIPWTKVRGAEKVYAPLVAAESSAASEAFRNLRTMVVLAKTADPEPFLMVTSAAQEEGKSFVAANLAVAVSQLGRRTLLIDGDLRRPSQHRLLGCSPKAGLADYLSRRAGDPAELVQRPAGLPALDVLTGGTRAASPSELLSGERLEELVAWARQRYDRVIVDAPPVFPVSDSLLWGRHARSSILVLRAGRTPAPLVQMACARLREAGVDILGGVVNAVPPGWLGALDGHDFDRYRRRIAQ